MRISYENYLLLDDAFIMASDEKHVMVIVNVDRETGRLVFSLSWGSMYEADSFKAEAFAKDLLSASKYVSWLNNQSIVLDRSLPDVLCVGGWSERHRKTNVSLLCNEIFCKDRILTESLLTK